MSSKRRIHRNQCGGKRKYVDQTEAVQMAIERSRATGEGIVAYKCRWCHSWHIGHHSAGPPKRRE